MMHWDFFSLLGGGWATKEKMANAIFSFVRSCNSQLLSGACVSQKQPRLFFHNLFNYPTLFYFL